MLQELKVTNFAIIDRIQMTFQEGLNILSGETGAGKSVLLKSLALLMGEKALSDTVRQGHDFAVIEGLFDLSQRKDIKSKLLEMGIDCLEEMLIVRRVISAHGKSKVYLNGALSALSNLREVVAPLIEVTGQSAPLIEMTGQHENKNLQDKAYHLDLLDFYSGSLDLRKKVQDHFQEVKNLEKEILETEAKAKESLQRADFLKYQLDEISQLQIEPGNEEGIANEVSKLKNVNQLKDFVSSSETQLYSDEDSSLVRIHRVIQQGLELAETDKALNEKLENLSQAKTLIEEFIYDIRDYGSFLSIDPQELLNHEQQLSLLRQLQKKYGTTIDEIYQTKEKIENEVHSIDNLDEIILALKNKKDHTFNSLEKLCTQLHKKRLAAALTLEKSVNLELNDLNMKGVTFHISVKPAELTSNGSSDVEFLIQTAKKDKKRSLAKFASGGELSRILLSLKKVLGMTEQPRTYLFDEVDTGVSGETAEKVGRKLKSIAQGQQVICVTHLPQVASFADHHFFIQKDPRNDGTYMEVRALERDDRIQEVARLLSGEKVTKSSLGNAKELLKNAKS